MVTTTAQVSQTLSSQRSALFPLAVITITAMLVPIVFYIGGLLMTPLRFLYLFTVPYLVIRWIKGDFGRLIVPDYAMMFFVTWMTLAMGIHHPKSVITFAGSNVLLILGGYLTARGAIRSTTDFLALTRFLAFVTILLLPLGAYEAVLHKASPILIFLNDLPGVSSYRDSDYCCRLNLNRAQTVFTHPIHFGLFCSMAFSLYFFGMTNHVSFAQRFIVACLIAAAAFMSVSSGAVLVIGLQAIIIMYGVMLHNQPWQWRTLTKIAVVGYAFLELMTTKIAFIAVAGKLAFDSTNVWLRETIYNVGMDQIARTPIFGFGVNRLPLPHWMSGSLDNYWLATGVQYGLPTMVSCLVLFFWPMFRAGGKRFRKGSDLYYVRVSWTILLVGLALSLATVYVWDTVQSMIYLMLGSGMFLFYANEPEDGEAVADSEPVVPRQKRYTRFPAGRLPSGSGGPIYARKLAAH